MQNFGGHELLFVMISAFLIAVFILLINPHKEYARWFALTALSGSIGAAGRVFLETILPYLQKNYSYFVVHEHSCLIIHIILNIFDVFFTSYFFLMFSLSYTNRIKSKKTKWFLLIIPLLTFLFTVITMDVKPKFEHNYLIVTPWVSVYTIYSFYLLFKKYIKEKYQRKKLNIAIIIILGSPVFMQLITVFWPRMFGYYEVFRYNTLIFVLWVPLILYFIINYGLFDFKIYIQKRNLESSINTISSGTAILNHSLKNHVSLISSCLHNVAKEYKENNRNEPDELKIIDNSANHLLKMINRISENTKDVVINKTLCRIKSILIDLINSLKNELDRRGINVELECQEDLEINCDQIHIREILQNILKNSIEAFDNRYDEKLINIKVIENKKDISISIKDNAKGMSEEEVRNVFEPFYSTKKTKQNFGLGLTYCYNVIKKHNGKIEISSTPGKGTTVSIVLNK